METACFMLYGVISNTNSLVLQVLLFLERKLTYLGIYKLPAASTLSDANLQASNECLL